MKRPNRYDKDSTHTAFGIMNWFHKIVVRNQNYIDELIAFFLIDKGFKEPSGTSRQIVKAKQAFISNRFPEFTNHVIKNLPALGYEQVRKEVVA